jgi:5-formyltetrahydrofolate cyclo-ligase
LVSRGRKIGFPKIDGETLAFHQIQNLNELTPGRLSLEPKSSALKISETSGVIVVPAVAFSRDGHRLGFGRGFYDRFLNQFPHFIRLGFAYDFQVSLQGFQSESHDEIMDFIICPSGVWGSSRTCF